MDAVDPKVLFEEGMSLIAKGSPGIAMEYFEKLIEQGNKHPSFYSWLGLSKARSKWDLDEAGKYCKMALQMDKTKPQYYLNLAEVYSLKGLKKKTIDTLKSGLNVDKRNRAIIKELAKFGIRRPPSITFLSRDNIINKCVGLILGKVGLR